VTGYASGLNSIDSAVIEECEHELNIRAGADFSWTDFQKPAAGNQPETPSITSPVCIDGGSHAHRHIWSFWCVGGLLFSVADTALDDDND
jgi:hypothetical protein